MLRQRRRGAVLLVPQHELTKHETFPVLEAARLSVFKYVETFYNPVRLHQTLGYKSPYQFEAQYAPRLAA